MARSDGNQRQRREPLPGSCPPGLLDEGNMAPGAGTETTGVVVRHAEHLQPVLGDAVPLLAGDLARLAADADRAVGEEPLAGRWLSPPGVSGGVPRGRPAGHQVASPEGVTRVVPVSTLSPARRRYSSTYRGSAAPVGRRPGWMSHDRRLQLLDVHVRIERHSHDIVGGVTAHDRAAAAHSPVVWQADLVDDPATDGQRREPVRDQHPRLDGGARGDDGCPAEMLEPTLCRKLGRDLAEELRLQLGKVWGPPAHAAGGVVLGEPVRRHHVRETPRSPAPVATGSRDSRCGETSRESGSTAGGASRCAAATRPVRSAPAAVHPGARSERRASPCRPPA